jgi:hypothetical protein
MLLFFFFSFFIFFLAEPIELAMERLPGTGLEEQLEKNAVDNLCQERVTYISVHEEHISG